MYIHTRPMSNSAYMHNRPINNSQCLNEILVSATGVRFIVSGQFNSASVTGLCPKLLNINTIILISHGVNNILFSKEVETKQINVKNTFRAMISIIVEHGFHHC